MKKDGTKTINISNELHQKIKVYCAKNGLKINEFIEKEINSIILNYTWEFDNKENLEKMQIEIENKIK